MGGAQLTRCRSGSQLAGCKAGASSAHSTHVPAWGQRYMRKQSSGTSRRCNLNEPPPIATGPARRGAYTPPGGHRHGFTRKKAPNGGGPGHAGWSTRHGPPSRAAWVCAVRADQTAQITPQVSPTARHRAMGGSDMLFARREPMKGDTPASFIGV